MQNAWAALLWLRRDLQGSKTVTMAEPNGPVVFEAPFISAKDRNRLQWREIQYYLEASERQLRRNIHGSHNIVAENVIEFTFSLDPNDSIAIISITTETGLKTAQYTTRVWLRNMR
ncbi:MAG TPA: hypothetical protein VJ036_03425 [bacterium]|nr:hypothetical protein [bacterium]